jgi:hypothetical protein
MFQKVYGDQLGVAVEKRSSYVLFFCTRTFKKNPERFLSTYYNKHPTFNSSRSADKSLSIVMFS